MKNTILVTIILLTILFSGCSIKSYDYVRISQNFKKYQEYIPLIKRYMRYWECMSRKDLECAFEYEMPYQRFLHDFSWYKSFNSGNSVNYKIILLDIKPYGKHKVLVKSKFISADNKVTYVFYDTWYNVDDTWYHKMKVSLLPFGDDKD